jgi:hypothetical protein
VYETGADSPAGEAGCCGGLKSVSCCFESDCDIGAGEGALGMKGVEVPIR